MDKRLQEMLDHYEINKTLAEYCHGADRCDEVRMGSVYLEDSWDDHGMVKATGADFTRIMSEMIRTTSKSLYHLLGQSLIKVDGDEAGAETYFFAVSRNTKDGVEMCNHLGGRFVDRLRREDGVWKIKHRIVVRDWAESLPILQDWTAEVGLTDGQRTSADPAFAVLGREHSDTRSGKA